MKRLARGPRLMHHRRICMIQQYTHRIRCRIALEDLQEEQALGHQDGAVNNGTSREEPIFSDEDIGQDDDGFDLASFLNTLSPKDRQIFREENSELSPLMFMTKREKKQYFEKLNSTFKTDLERTPTRQRKTKKILKFKNDFTIKPFSENQRVSAVTRTKQLTQRYQPRIHFG